MAAPTGWGIWGCGRMTDRRMAPAFRDCSTSRLIAFLSRDAGKADAYRTKHSARRAYGDADAFLSDSDIDVVYVATPPAKHVEHVLRCIEAGKHVLVDKPIATNGNDARKLARAAESRGLTLGVLHQQRFHPAVRELIQYAADGTLGRVHTLRIQIAMWFRLDGNWRYDAAIAGGGAAMDLAPHALDILLLLLGRPMQVTARTATHCLADSDVEDFCAATIEFASGSVGLIDVSYSAHAYGGRVEAFGDRGTFVADGCMQQANEYATRLRQAGQASEIQTRRYDGHCFRDVIEDVSASIREHRAPIVTAGHATNVLHVVDAIYASARSGRTEMIETDGMSGVA